MREKRGTSSLQQGPCLPLGGACTALLGAGRREEGEEGGERGGGGRRGDRLSPWAGDGHIQPSRVPHLAHGGEGRCQAHSLSALGRHCTQHAPVVQGRVACEINSGDELASTELIFGGVLTQLTPEEAVAVLSALVFQVSVFCFFFSLLGIWLW